MSCPLEKNVQRTAWCWGSLKALKCGWGRVRAQSHTSWCRPQPVFAICLSLASWRVCKGNTGLSYTNKPCPYDAVCPGLEPNLPHLLIEWSFWVGWLQSVIKRGKPEGGRFGKTGYKVNSSKAVLTKCKIGKAHTSTFPSHTGLQYTTAAEKKKKKEVRVEKMLTQSQ